MHGPMDIKSYLVSDFTIEIYYDARPYGRQILPCLRFYYKKNILRCTALWTSNLILSQILL